jgi:hypothetical protein
MGDDSGDGDVGRFEARLQYLAEREGPSAVAELKELYGETVGRFLREVCREAGFDPADSDVWSSPALLVARIAAMSNARYGFRSLAQILGMNPGTEGMAHIVSRVESEHNVLVTLREVYRMAGLDPDESDVLASPHLLVSRVDELRNAQDWLREIANVLRMDPDAATPMDIVRRVTSEHEALVGGFQAAMSDRAVGELEPGPEVLAPVPVAMILVRLANQVSPVAPGMARPGGMHLQSSGALWDERVRMSGWLLRLATAVLDARDDADAQVRITAALADLAGERSGGEGDG